VVNPNLVKRNKENRNNTQSKYDKKDVLSDRRYGQSRYYSFVRPSSESFKKMRVFKDVSCKGAIATLRLFPTPKELIQDLT